MRSRIFFIDTQCMTTGSVAKVVVVPLERMAQADAEADAIRVKAQAQTDALQAIAVALNKNPNLITYEYVEKLSPNIRAMLVPNNAPLILPLPDLMAEATKGGLTTTVTPTLTDSLTTTLPTTTTIMPAENDRKGE